MALMFISMSPIQSSFKTFQVCEPVLSSILDCFLLSVETPACSFVVVCVCVCVLPSAGWRKKGRQTDNHLFWGPNPNIYIYIYVYI